MLGFPLSEIEKILSITTFQGEINLKYARFTLTQTQKNSQQKYCKKKKKSSACYILFYHKHEQISNNNITR